MQAQEMMTPDPACCTPEDSARLAAELMRRHDCGAIPVVEPGSLRVCGMITDRDIAIRGVAEGMSADARVADLMTSDVECCGLHADLREVEQVMSLRQVRRVPIIDAEGRLCGIVAQADLAQIAGDSEVGPVVRHISDADRPPFRSAQGD